MARDDDEFDELMARLRGGDDDAAAEVFHRFARRLVALARSRLDERMRGKVDPEDVLQSVFRSFFTRQRDGQFDVESWGGLWGLLAVMTVRKCANRVAYFRAACRAADRERGPAPAEGSDAPWEAMADEPTPSEAAALTETLEALMRGLEDRDRGILTLHLQGYTIPEISEQTGRSERTVCRVMDRVRNHLRRMDRESA
jgi:RNA polymerase sigma-70 factor (ECF subfamily)